MNCEKCNKPYKLKLVIKNGEKNFKQVCECGEEDCLAPIPPKNENIRIFTPAKPADKLQIKKTKKKKKRID